MPGIPPGDPAEGQHYLELLKLLRALMPDKELSFCAPASFWYMKQFPVKEMAEVSDYVIYMTYDLHGQVSFPSRPGLQVSSPHNEAARSAGISPRRIGLITSRCCPTRTVTRGLV
jgi:hypothetical protein